MSKVFGLKNPKRKARKGRVKGWNRKIFRRALMVVKIAVLINGHPDKCLSEKQATDLELLITNKIERNSEGFFSNFLLCKLVNGVLGWNRLTVI